MFKSEKQKAEEERAWIRRLKWEYAVVFSVAAAIFLLLAATFMPWEVKDPDFALMLGLAGMSLFGAGWVTYLGVQVWRAHVEWEKSVR